LLKSLEFSFQHVTDCGTTSVQTIEDEEYVGIVDSVKFCMDGLTEAFQTFSSATTFWNVFAPVFVFEVSVVGSVALEGRVFV
jgi:hypothetical protein